MTTSTAYRRKKQPDVIRRKLLDRAAELAMHEGFGALTIQVVAEAAGVTKGGLFHHFASKQVLVDAVFDDLMAQLSAEVDALIAADPEPRGSFTRAYVQATFDDPILAQPDHRAALHVSIVAEPSLRRRWSQWFATRLERHRATDDGAQLEIVRYAADGAWFALILQEDGWPALDAAETRDRLIAMTYAA